MRADALDTPPLLNKDMCIMNVRDAIVDVCVANRGLTAFSPQNSPSHKVCSASFLSSMKHYACNSSTDSVQLGLNDITKRLEALEKK